MSDFAAANKIICSFWKYYSRILRAIVFFFVVLSALGLFVMMFITVADVIGRQMGRSITGAYDIVKITGALTLAGALPYTTAVKGHVAIEFFFHKLNRTGRIFTDICLRVCAIALFVFLCVRNIAYGKQLYLNGQVTQTLQLPLFWVPCVISACCLIVSLVITYNLFHPGKELIKP